MAARIISATAHQTIRELVARLARSQSRADPVPWALAPTAVLASPRPMVDLCAIVKSGTRVLDAKQISMNAQAGHAQTVGLLVGSAKRA